MTRSTNPLIIIIIIIIIEMSVEELTKARWLISIETTMPTLLLLQLK